MRIYVSVPSVAARVYAVKEIYASRHALYDIKRSAHPHEISWLAAGKMRHCLIKYMIHLLVTLSDGKTAKRVSVQIKLGYLVGIGLPHIVQYTALIDAK